jgi:ribosome-binding factor A
MALSQRVSESRVSDCHVYTRPLSYDFADAKVYYQNSSKLKINRIEDLKTYRMKFKTELQYWYYVINHIKEKVLIKLPDLRKAKIFINTFDTNNVIHQFILTVAEFIGNLLKKQFVLNKVIFIYIQYENKIKFIGNV